MSSHDSSTDQPGSSKFDGLLPNGSSPQVPDPYVEDALQRVDQVAIRKLGGFNFLEPGQWVALSRDDRMRLIKDGSVIFLSEGEEVPLRAALQYLQALASPNNARSARPLPGTEPLGFDFNSTRPGQV